MFKISQEIEQIKQMVKDYVTNEVEPVAQQIEEEDQIPQSLIDQAKNLGLFGMSIPEEYGGIGLNAVGKAAVLGELGRSSHGFATLISAHTGIGSVGIVKLGSNTLKKKYLPQMATGEKIGAFALSEPGAGSDATSLSTTAEKRGDKWVLNGTKHFITNATVADVFTVFALTDRKKGARGGITSLVVDRDSPGLTIGAVDKKMGLRGAHTAQLIFEDCEIPEENVVGEIGMGYMSALKILGEGRVGLASRAVGACEKLIELSARYAQEREQFNQPIGNNQAIQWMLADMATETEAAKMLMMKAAIMIDEGEKAIRESSMAKLYASEVFNRVADMAVQIHGGMGYVADYPIERFFRDARITTIYEGTSEVQRIIIARDVLKKHSL